MAQLDSAAPS